MEPGTIRLILRDTEAEVVEAALKLYLMARPKAHDTRYDYSYRIAQGVLESLRRDLSDDPHQPLDDDGDTPSREENPSTRRYEGIED